MKNELKLLGNIYGEQFGTGYAGNVWDKNGICPTLTCTGGVVEEPQQSSSNRVIQIGSLANQVVSTRNNPQSYRIYRIDGVSPTLNCAQGGGRNPYIVVDDERKH